MKVSRTWLERKTALIRLMCNLRKLALAENRVRKLLQETILERQHKRQANSKKRKLISLKKGIDVVELVGLERTSTSDYRPQFLIERKQKDLPKSHQQSLSRDNCPSKMKHKDYSHRHF
jgi:hypothetical protein